MQHAAFWQQNVPSDEFRRRSVPIAFVMLIRLEEMEVYFRMLQRTYCSHSLRRNVHPHPKYQLFCLEHVA